jgi:hypothetical protein
MEQSPSWKANNHSVCQGIPRLSWNPKVHYSGHKSLPLVSVLSHMNPIHNFPLCFLKIHSIITLTMPRSSAWSPSLRFCDRSFACTSNLFHACYMYRLSHAHWFYHLITCAVVYKLWRASFFSLLQPLTTSSFLGPNILFSLCSSLRVRNQVSPPYKITGDFTLTVPVLLIWLFCVS